MKHPPSTSLRSIHPAILLWLLCLSPTRDVSGAVVLADDFEPDIDPMEWSAFGGSVLATNWGGSVSGANSLWFGGDGSRFAATRPLDTTAGGWIDFHLRIAENDDAPWWDSPEMPAEGIGLEYSTDGGTSWATAAAYDSSSYRTWSRQVLPIPGAARSAHTILRWRQWQHSGGYYDHWALDDVAVMVGPTPPILSVQPTSLVVPVGGMARFSVSACGTPPLSYQWQHGGVDLPAETNSTLTLSAVALGQAGTYRVVVSNAVASILSSEATLTVVALSGEPFRIASLTTNGMVVVDHETAAGDEWSAMAVSRTHLFYSGRNTTARFALADLAGGIGVGRRYETLVSDLRSETVYALGDGTNLLGWGGGTVTTLLEIDGATGLLTGGSVALSQPLAVEYRSGLFAGYGRIVLHTQSRVYDISLPSGTVVDCGAMVLPFAETTVSGSYGGVAEFWDRMISLVYVSNAQCVVRLRVPDGDATVLARLRSGNEDSIAVSPAWYRWYVHDRHSLAVAEATFEPALPVSPRIESPPRSQTVFAETNVTLSVTAIGPGPLSYQWRFQDAAIPDATNASLALSSVSLDRTGNYCVVVGNAYGSVTSSVATLTVVLPPVGSLDFTFDPDTRGDDLVNAIAVQSDGKILLGGRFHYSYGGFRGGILRLHPDGREDSDFLRLAAQPPNNTVQAVVVQSDGKTLMAGEFTAAGEWPNRICRLNAGGDNVDLTFHPGTGPNNTVYALALQPDGKVLVGGTFTTVNGVARNRIARLNEDGSVDATFNPGVGPEAGSEVRALALQGDGKVLIGGTFASVGGTPRLRLARLNANGGLDSSYYPGGGLAIFDSVSSLALLPDGRVLAGGRFPPVGLSQSGWYTYRGGLARLNADGSVDAAFNPGVQVEWLNGIPGYAVVRSIALQADGKILIGGSFNLVNGVGRTHLARLNRDGGVDTTLAPDIINGDGVCTVATQGDGKVLAGGRFFPVNLLRFNGDDGPPALATQPADAQASLGFPVSFQVTLSSGKPPLSYQWYFNGTEPIADATNLTLTLSQVRTTDAGTYGVTVSNALGEARSEPAVLSVVSGPRLVSAGSLNGYAIGLRFNVPVTAASAQRLLNYSITSGGPITNATLRPDGCTVLLRSQYPASTPFAVTASEIADAAFGYSGGGRAVGRVEGLESADLGSPAYPGSAFVCQSNTFEVVAGGADLWDTLDQGHFVYAERAGDFDVKVRVRSLGPSDPSAKAGLMVRESLNASSATLHLDTMPPPPMRNTAEATIRPTTGGTTVGWGMPGTPYDAGLIPAGWPNAWLRLARTGDEFFAYSSRDGVYWTLFGQTSRVFASTLYLGMASTAHNNATRTTALLSDYGLYEGELADALDISGLVWTSMGDHPWRVQTAVTHDGSEAAQSGTIGHGATSILQAAVIGPGTLTFWWKVSSEPGQDRLTFEVAGAEQCSINGEVDWKQRTVAIPPGPQTLAWIYLKNDSGVQGSDCGWLDQVVFSPDPVPPVITAQPADQTVKSGSNAVFRVVANSLTPITFQWVFNETNLLGVPQSELIVPNVGSNQLGSYFVVVGNASGMVTSRVATLELAWPPTIVQQPQNLTVIAGDHAAFTVVVTNNATLPIGYQLRKGSTPITNVVLYARTCTLTVCNVTTNAACRTNGPGNYRIVATNAASYLPGVGSSLAKLTVLPATTRPNIDHCALGQDGCFQLQFSGEPGARYTVLASTNLVDWQQVGVATETGVGEFEFTDTAAPERRTCFYRLRLP